MASTHSHLLKRVALILIGIWIAAAAVLIILSGPHYDFHELAMAFLLVIGCAMIVGSFYLLSRWLRGRDRAEELLRQTREHYSSLVEKSLMGIFISQDGILRFSNPRFAETHGFTPEEIVGRAALDLTHPDDRPAAKAIVEGLTSGELQDQTNELRCVTRDGRTIWVQRRSRVIEHEGRPAILVNEIDITEQKLAAVRLNEAHEQIKRLMGRILRQHEVDRRRVASEIHEDFAQSLNAIKFKVEALVGQVEVGGRDTARESLKPIVADVQQTVASIRRLAQTLYPIAVDAFGIVSSLRWLFESHAETHPGYRIRYHLDVEEPLVPGDLKVATFRMVEKLLADGIQSAPAGSLTVYLQALGSKVMLAVKVDLPPGSALFDSSIPESLEVADFRTRIESCGGQFSLSRRDTAIRVWSSWLLPAGETPTSIEADSYSAPRPAALLR